MKRGTGDGLRSLKVRAGLAVLSLMVVVLVLGASPAFAADTDPWTQVYSISSEWTFGDGEVQTAVISADGRWVAFVSRATNIAPNDTDSLADVFVYDRLGRTCELVSVSSDGAKANGYSISIAISDDGRYVAFTSWATNLVAGDTNGKTDVFVRDRVARTTTRVNVGVGGVQSNGASLGASLSGDGRRIAWASDATNLVTGDTNGVQDVFYRDWAAGGVTYRASYLTAEGNGISADPKLSADGRYLVFSTQATNLLADDVNGVSDIVRRDLLTNGMLRVSLSDGEAHATGASHYPSISANGRYVAFRSLAANLVTGDTNAKPDVFVRDTTGGTTVRVSVDSAEAQSTTGADATRPAINWDGSIVAFETDYPLVADDTNGVKDVYVRRVTAGTTQRASIYGPYEDGGQSIDFVPATDVSLSSEGELVCFITARSDLVGGDTNGLADAFVRTMRPRVAYINQDVGGVSFDRWVTGFSTVYTSGNYAYSRWANSWLEFQFSGTKIEWYGPKQPFYGMAEVYIDGVYQGTVNCYQAAPGTFYTRIWQSGTLANGDHTLRIRLTGTKDPASSDIYVVVDQFWVTTMAQGMVKTRTDDMDPAVIRTGTWISPTNTTYFASRYSYSRWPTATLQLRFMGRRVAWIGPKTNMYGYAKIYIDGAYYTTVDQYGATAWRGVVWEKTDLPYGLHTIHIVPTGTKRAASTGTNIVVDAIDVRP